MPIYEFECEGCGAVFEELVAASTERSEGLPPDLVPPNAAI